MEVDFTPINKPSLAMPSPAADCTGPKEAMQQALLLWEERERQRLEILAAVECPKPLWHAAKAVPSRPARIRPTRQRHHPRGMARLAAEQNSRG